MQSDERILRQEAPEIVVETVMHLFGMNMKLEEKKTDWEYHGWFRLVFRYTPKNYFIYFEREFNSFNIRVVNGDGGYIALEQLVDYESCITGQNVYKAVDKLRTVLEADLSFYKVINGKRYRQINGQYKREKIKDFRRSDDDSNE